MKYLYAILPSGNASEFPKLDKELLAREVRATYCTMKGGGRIYRLPSSTWHLLPRDKQGPYLGDDNSGYTIYPMVGIDEYRKDVKASRWLKVKP